MLIELLNRLFGSEIQREPKQRKNEMADEVEVKNEKQQQVTAVNVKPQMMYDNPDLNILAANYGELKPGKEIRIELGLAAKLLGRKRVRLDAFAGLIKKLRNDYGVELLIYSRRTKLKQKGGSGNVHN